MDRHTIVSVGRIVFSTLTLVAVVAQLVWGTRNNPGFDAANFFSFFTIESNVFAAVVLLVFALRPGEPTPVMEFLRGAAVTYMATTGVVYGLLLSGYTAELQTALPWVNNVVHRIFPLVLVADWLITPPRRTVPFRRALSWLLFPALFLAYSLVRGPVVDWYPYPFLDPDRVGGYGGVAAYAAGIALFVGLMCWLVTWSGRSIHLLPRHGATA
jgi:hypothetical protein